MVTIVVENIYLKCRYHDIELSPLHVYSNFPKVKDSELSESLEGLIIECDTTILNKVGDFSWGGGLVWKLCCLCYF